MISGEMDIEMPEDKRMIENYEVQTAIHIGGKEIIFAEDPAATIPYLTCNCSWNNPFGVDQYSEAVISDDYLEIMGEFLRRVTTEVQNIAGIRAERGITSTPLTVADCISGSDRDDYTNQLIVIKPENIAASARTADNQLLLATGGNGCNPESRGTAVFTTNLFTGKDARWNRQDIAGIIKPESTPKWAKEKMSDLNRDKNEKPSIREQLMASKKAVARQNIATKPIRDRMNEL